MNFKGISIILFLNKSDLLAQKVASKETDIRWYYPQFTGDPHSLRDVQVYLLNMFANVRREPKTTLYHHFTTAIDTHNIEVVFNSVKDTILNRNLESLMLQWHGDFVLKRNCYCDIFGNISCPHVDVTILNLILCQPA